MAWTVAERSRIQKIQDMICDLQTAISNLAATQQVRQLLLIKQQEVITLQNRVTELETAIQLLQKKAF